MAEATSLGGRRHIARNSPTGPASGPPGRSSAELDTPDLNARTRFIALLVMGASGCGPPQERSAIPFPFAGYGADRSVMRGDHLRALDVGLSADLRQRPGLPCGLSP